MRITWKNLTLFAFLPGLSGSYLMLKFPWFYSCFAKLLYIFEVIVLLILALLIRIGIIGAVLCVLFCF